MRRRPLWTPSASIFLRPATGGSRGRCSPHAGRGACETEAGVEPWNYWTTRQLLPLGSALDCLKLFSAVAPVDCGLASCMTILPTPRWRMVVFQRPLQAPPHMPVPTKGDFLSTRGSRPAIASVGEPRDNSRATFVGEIGVGPLEQHSQPVTEADQENQMHEQPHH